MSSHLTSQDAANGAGAAARTFPSVRWARFSAADVLTALIIAILCLWAVAPGLFSGHDPISGIAAERLRGPSPDHWFGTDHLGRDVFARVVHGTRLTLSAALLASTIGLVFGTLLGLVAATLGGFVDVAVMRFVDVLLAIPGFLLALCLVTAMGPGTYSVAIAIGISSIATFARLARSEVLRVREFDFVEAAWLNGFSKTRTMLREILPNSATPVLALFAIEVSSAIIMIAALGFLGYGNPPPEPEWGVIIANGRAYLANSWWITTLPGLVLIVSVISFAHFSRRLRKASKL